MVKYLFAIPNGGHRHPVTAARMKAAGVRAGVSDLFLAYPMQDRHGLWIELKVGKGKPTRDQLAWIDSMVEVDYLGMVVWGWRAVVDSVDAYLGGLYTAAGVRLMVEQGRACWGGVDNAELCGSQSGESAGLPGCAAGGNGGQE